MTAVSEPAFEPARHGERTLDRLRGLVLGRTDEPAFVRPALVGLLGLAALLYVWNLTISGFANQYYSATALAASQSWSAWFFGSFDAANFITVDKPPLSTMLMGLSVRLFGLSSLSILLPEALLGVATVGVLFAAVRRTFGPVAGLLAGLFMAITPASVLIFRFNNPDALLTFLLVLSAYVLLRSIESGSLRWVALAGALVGLAFLTKYLQAYLVLPGYALAFGFSANTTLRRRIAGLGIALGSVLVASGWWVAIVEMIPAGSRPFIGGSTTGSPLDLIFGYDGLGRLFGRGGPGPGGGGGGAFGGEPSLLRLFNDQWFGEIAWFIPLAIAGLVVGLWLRRYAERSDRGLAGYLIWGTWFVTTAVVFSYMDGIAHSYYSVALAPAVAALAGAGLVDMWRLRARIWVGGLTVGAALLGTAWVGWTLLQRTPEFAGDVGPAAMLVGSVALLILVAVSVPGVRERFRGVTLTAAGLAVVAALLAPGAYAVATTGTAYDSGDPHPGPASVAGFGFGGRGSAGGFGGLGGATPGGFGGGPGGGGDDGGTSSALVDYLVANRGSARWIVAASGSGSAGAIEVATGLPVMAMGGFSGGDPTPTLEELQAYVRSGELRFVLAGGGLGGGFRGGFGGGSDSASVSTWVTSTCTPVSIGGATTSLYDCAGAAG